MADEDLSELAAKGRAARLAEDRKKTELRAKMEAEQSDNHRRQAAKRLSPLARNPLRWVFSIPGWMVWSLSFAMAFPYFRYFLNGGHPVHGSDKNGSKWVLDPHKEGYGLFYFFVATTTIVIAGIVWSILARRAGKRAFAAETAWADSQPFPVLGFPTAVGQDEYEYKIEMFFVSTRPPREQFGDALRGLDDRVREDSWSDYECRFVASYSRDDHPAKNAQRFAPTLHGIVALLVTMQQDHPIDRIEVRG